MVFGSLGVELPVLTASNDLIPQGPPFPQVPPLWSRRCLARPPGMPRQVLGSLCMPKPGDTTYGLWAGVSAARPRSPDGSTRDTSQSRPLLSAAPPAELLEEHTVGGHPCVPAVLPSAFVIAQYLNMNHLRTHIVPAMLDRTLAGF